MKKTDQCKVSTVFFEKKNENKVLNSKVNKLQIKCKKADNQINNKEAYQKMVLVADKKNQKIKRINTNII